MIEVQQLGKRYGDVPALDRISFAVGRGEVVGFLGPNGAGKTTTLRILACFLPATSGSARVAGFDCFRQPLAVRRHLGYLPENVAPYGEMRVEEYLDFRARLRRVPSSQRRRNLGETLDLCGLTDVRRRIVGQLSRGYRQRVGLADALVHRPSILLLDEPTIGLDPNQMRELRELIRRLGQDRTVLLSTHILSEVESLCRRVVIIDRGRIMAEDTLAGLRRRLQQGTRLRIEVRGPEAQAREALGRIARVRVEAASDEGPGAGDSEEHGYWLTAERGHDPRPEVAAALTARGLGLLELRSQPVSLEEIFCRITGERPADSADSAALAIPLPPASDHSPPASDRAPPDDGA